MAEPVYVSVADILGMSLGDLSASDDEYGGGEQRVDLSESPDIKIFPSLPDDLANLDFSQPEITYKERADGSVLSLSKKQLNRLAALDIYAIPSGGIGTVNASLFNPTTIKWLMENFETYEGCSLPRYQVYNHYLLHCKTINIKPINAASFGKVIRSVFLGLQTRRLGTRGNSKYHYCGMRIKPNSPLLNIAIDDVEPKKSTSSKPISRPPPAPVQRVHHTVQRPIPVLQINPWKVGRFGTWLRNHLDGLTDDHSIKHVVEGPQEFAEDYADPDMIEYLEDRVFQGQEQEFVDTEDKKPVLDESGGLVCDPFDQFGMTYADHTLLFYINNLLASQ